MPAEERGETHSQGQILLLWSYRNKLQHNNLSIWEVLKDASQYFHALS